MRKILILEDEEAVREFMVINLKRAGYAIFEAADSDIAVKLFDSNPDIDIALLDVMVPGTLDGIGICKYIRQHNHTCGIIMLTARAQEIDKVSGFLSGADDYVTKPFSTSELMARIDALYRRVSANKITGGQEGELESGPFRLDLRSRTLSKSGERIELTQVEFQIMKYLIENPNAALSREEILKAVWGEGYFGELKIVDVNIRRLRMKIEIEPSDPKFIMTVWGYGYKWMGNERV